MTDNDIKILKSVNESGDIADIGYYRTLEYHNRPIKKLKMIVVARLTMIGSI